MRLRLFALFAMSALLGACNVAMSDKPLFGEPQRSSALRLEDGIWTLDKPECVADLAKPRKDWPACIDWVIVNGNKALLGSDSKPGDGPEDILIVDGKPPLLQAKVTTSGSPPTWGYLVFHPQATSKTGRVTAVEVWAVACGIQEPGTAASPKIHPYPGFNEECRTTSVDALRAAASKERPADTEIVTWRWVRAETP
jgi:hypothetical protein